MNKFLLTWYGITDFRASLGFENTDGPIAGALAGDSYTHVVILGYTRSDDDPSELIEAQKTFAHELASIRDAGQDKDWKATNQFVSRFANTAVAHEYFEAWLKSKVVTLGCNTSVRLKSEKLRQLNDTEGIYAGAMRAPGGGRSAPRMGARTALPPGHEPTRVCRPPRRRSVNG